MSKDVLLINDTEDVYHWGCYGTSRALKDQLLKKGLNIVGKVPVAQAHSMTQVPDNLTDVRNENEFSSAYPELSEGIRASDAVVINGEGTIHGFRHGSKSLLYLAYVSKHLFGKKVFLINHSCYPKPGRGNVLEYYRAGYASCDYVAAREGTSADIIERKLGIDCAKSFDSLPLSIRKVWDEIPNTPIDKPYICLSGAVNYRTANSPIIAKRLLRRYPAHEYIYLAGSKTEGVNKEEPRVFKSLRKCIPHLRMFDAKSFHDWLSVIRHAEMLVSGRFHYTIAAVCLGTRAICFESNTPKLNSLANDLGLSKVITRKPSLLFNYQLWRQVRHIPARPDSSLMDYMCAMASKNYDWDI